MSSRSAFGAASVLPLAVVVSFGLATGCSTKKQKDAPAPSPSASDEHVPPAGAWSGTPLSSFADAGDIDGKTPYDSARDYLATGQVWMARLVLEPKALGPDGTKPEAELLGIICSQQGDAPCVAEASKRAGHKIKYDGGLGATSIDAGGEHAEPDTDLSRARTAYLKGQYATARRLLDPKLLDGSASREEIRLLQLVCERQPDRVCVALCQKSLKE